MKAKQTKNSTNARRVNESNMIHSIKIEEIVVSLLLLLFIPNLLVAQSFDIDRNSIGIIYQDNSDLGTGFICEYPDLIITCAHLFENENKEDSFIYKTTDGKFGAKMIYFSEERDISILKLNNLEIDQPLKLSAKFDLLAGAPLLLSGADLKVSDSAVLISEIRTEAITLKGKNTAFEKRFIEFYGVADHGYSGGPMLTWDGEVYGILQGGSHEIKDPTDPEKILNIAMIADDLRYIFNILFLEGKIEEYVD